jgi:hypothetical protein
MKQEKKVYPKIHKIQFFAVYPHTFCVVEATLVDQEAQEKEHPLMGFSPIKLTNLTHWQLQNPTPEILARYDGPMIIMGVDYAKGEQPEVKTGTFELLGHARCHPNDSYSDYKGKKESLADALIDLDAQERKRIWDYFFKHFPDPATVAAKEKALIAATQKKARLQAAKRAAWEKRNAGKQVKVDAPIPPKEELPF